MTEEDMRELGAIEAECSPVAKLLAAKDAEIEALRKDAERYRWLRQRHDVLCRMYTAQGLGLDLSAAYVRSAEQFDGVLDTAMEPRPELGAA